jgi:hypothetical protein
VQARITFIVFLRERLCVHYMGNTLFLQWIFIYLKARRQAPVSADAPDKMHRIKALHLLRVFRCSA